MAKTKTINTAIWNDTWFEKLSTDHKLLFIYLLTNELNSMLGVYEISIRKISFETGIETDIIEDGLNVFREQGKVGYLENNIILYNFLKYQKFNDNMKKSAIDTYNKLPKKLRVFGNQLDRNKTEASFLTLCNGFDKGSEIEFNLIESNKELNIIEDECHFPKTENSVNTAKEIFNDLTGDSYYPVERISAAYSRSEILLNSVSNTTGKSVEEILKALPDFEENLRSLGRGVEQPKEFAKYFRNILKGDFKLEPAKKNNPEGEYAWSFGDVQRKTGTKEQYETAKKNFDQPGFKFRTLKSPENV